MTRSKLHYRKKKAKPNVKYETELEWGNSYLICECEPKLKKPLFIEYAPNSRYHYDGVSEVQCQNCERRWGRWTRVLLGEGEVEPPYGVWR